MNKSIVFPHTLEQESSDNLDKCPMVSVGAQGLRPLGKPLIEYIKDWKWSNISLMRYFPYFFVITVFLLQISDGGGMGRRYGYRKTATGIIPMECYQSIWPFISRKNCFSSGFLISLPWSFMHFPYEGVS